jgi:WD40 repeat protein
MQVRRVMTETLGGQARPRSRLRRPRGRWLWLSVVVVLAIAGTAIGLALSRSGTPADRGSYPLTAVFSADGRYLVTAGVLDAQVIDPASGQVLARWQPGTRLDSIGISRDDKTITTAGDGRVIQWSVRDVLAAGVGGVPRPLASYPVPNEQFPDEQLSADGALLFIVDTSDQSSAVWSTAARRVTARISGEYLAVSPDDRVLATAGPFGSGLELWDIAATPPRQVPADPSALPVFTPGDGVLTPRKAPGGATQLLDSVTGKQLLVLPELSALNPVAYSPAAGLVALGSADDDSVTVWSVASGRVVAHVIAPDEISGEIAPGVSGVFSVAFSPNGKTMVVVPSGGPQWLWQVPSAVLRSASPR